jgi:hypothetical protein
MTTTPHTHPDLYMSVYVGGLKSPGKVTLSGYERDHDWDVQKAKGSTGATTVNHGPSNGGFTASFYLADFEDCEAWDDFQLMLASSVEGPKPKALAAYHPDLVRNKILDVVVKSIGTMVHDGKGGATVVCKFIEYKPPKAKPAVKADATGKARTGTTTVNDPNAARKAELAALVAQAQLP